MYAGYAKRLLFVNISIQLSTAITYGLCVCQLVLEFLCPPVTKKEIKRALKCTAPCNISMLLYICAKCTCKALSIVKDPTHTNHNLFILPPSQQKALGPHYQALQELPLTARRSPGNCLARPKHPVLVVWRLMWHLTGRIKQTSDIHCFQSITGG